MNRLIDSFPGFVFQISKHHSIVLTNNKLSVPNISKTNKPSKLVFNFSRDAVNVFLSWDSKKILVDGTIKNTYTQKVFKNIKECGQEQAKLSRELINYNKDKTMYSFKVKKISDDDMDILFIDNLSKYFGLHKYNAKTKIIFKEKEGVVRYIQKLLDIEREVSISSEDIEYWNTGKRKLKYKVWELMNDNLISSLLLIKRDIEKCC